MYKDDEELEHLYSKSVDTSFHKGTDFYTNTLGHMDSYLHALGYTVIQVSVVPMPYS